MCVFVFGLCGVFPWVVGVVLRQFLQDPDEDVAKIDRTVRSQCGNQVGTLTDWA